MKAKEERDQEWEPANPRWCGKETWHVMKVEIRVTYWMTSLEYLSLCVSHPQNEGGGRDIAERAPCQFCRWTLWAHLAACHLLLERSTLFAPAESGDILLGNFMDSHHSHSHHSLWILGYWGALSVMWVADHLRKTDWAHSLTRFLGEFTAFLPSSPLKCKPTLFPGPWSAHGVEPFPNRMPFGKFLNITISQFPQMSDGNFTIPNPFSLFALSSKFLWPVVPLLPENHKEGEWDESRRLRSDSYLPAHSGLQHGAWILFHRTLESSDKGWGRGL